MFRLTFEYKHASDAQLLLRHETKWGISYPILANAVRGLYHGAAVARIEDDSGFLNDLNFLAFPGVKSSEDDLRMLRYRLAGLPPTERSFLAWAKRHKYIKQGAPVSITRYWRKSELGSTDVIHTITITREEAPK